MNRSGREKQQYTKKGIYKAISEMEDKDIKTLIKAFPKNKPKTIMKILYEWQKNNNKTNLITDKQNIDSKEACILVSCKPSIHLLTEIQKDYPEINLEKTKKIVIEIEKKLYSKNLFRSSKVIVACAIWLVNRNITRKKIIKISKVSGTTIRTNLRLLDIIPEAKPLTELLRHYKKTIEIPNLKRTIVKRTRGIPNIDNVKDYYNDWLKEEQKLKDEQKNE